MHQKFLYLSIVLLSSLSFQQSSAQLAVSKMLGKDAKNFKMGLGVFVNYGFPLNDEGTKMAMLELADFAYFRSNNPDNITDRAYVSIKAGYRHIFSETKTGFYIEPQAGYCRVAWGDGSYGDGFAAAFEAGYSLEVGERGNNFNFGLKYEADLAGSDKTISSIGFRVAYSYGLFRKKYN